MPHFKDILHLIRVKQWIKNAFVLAPLFFSLKFTNLAAVEQTLITFISFCFISSFVYINNDLADIEKDRLHPVKKNRPLPSGKISASFARILSLFLFAAAFILTYFFDSENRDKVMIVFALYIILNIFYSFKLKHIAILDVFIIATGFILRVYAGAYAIGVPISSYIFMTTLFLSLFLGFSKRLSEAVRTAALTRGVLEQYTVPALQNYVVITISLTIMSYALYTLEPSTIARFSTNRLIYSIVFVIYGLFRYLNLANHANSQEDPTENLLKDKALIITCLGYVLFVLSIFLKII